MPPDPHSTQAGSVTRCVRGNLPLLLSAEQVAAELGMSTSWVRKHISAERIPVQHLGRNVRIHRVTLPELAENGLDREMQ